MTPTLRPRRRRFWRALIVLTLGLVLGHFMLEWMENRLVFPASTAADFWAEPGDPRIRDVWIPVAGSTDVHAWWLPPPEGASEALLICHGNGGNLSGRGPSMAQFADVLQRGVLIFDYPGYGKSPGSPSEATCVASAEAAFDWLTARGIPATGVTIYGESLGGGVAVELALRREHKAVVLMKTFTSLPAAAKNLYPFLPTFTLMRNRFDSLSKMPRMTRPVLMFAGTLDTLTPYRHSEDLFRACPDPRELIALEGDDHNSPLPEWVLPRIERFLGM